MNQKWSMFWMATALGHRDLCQTAWDGMESESRKRTIFEVFKSEEERNRIIGGNVQLFADFVLRLLRNEKSVEFIVYIFKTETFLIENAQNVVIYRFRIHCRV